MFLQWLWLVRYLHLTYNIGSFEAEKWVYLTVVLQLIIIPEQQEEVRIVS
jgi:hypothetical protein